MPVYLLLFTLFFSANDPVLDTIFDEALKRGIPREFLEQAFNKKNISVHKIIPELSAIP